MLDACVQLNELFMAALEVLSTSSYQLQRKIPTMRQSLEKVEKGAHNAGYGYHHREQ